MNLTLRNPGILLVERNVVEATAPFTFVYKASGLLLVFLWVWGCCFLFVCFFVVVFYSFFCHPHTPICIQIKYFNSSVFTASLFNAAPLENKMETVCHDFKVGTYPASATFIGILDSIHAAQHEFVQTPLEIYPKPYRNDARANALTETTETWTMKACNVQRQPSISRPHTHFTFFALQPTTD